MAYEEYDYYNEPSPVSLKESLREILYGLQDRTKLRETGTSLKEALQLTPNVTESLSRGGIAQAIGTSGDLRDLSNTINSYLPKSVRNFTRAAEFLANPYATAIQQTAPTTEETLDFVPRATSPYEGYKQHETLGEYVAPSLGYFGGKAAKAYGNYVGPTAYKAVEDYLTKTGGILNAVEPGEAKKIQEVASAIDELGFHSPLENAILKIQQPKGTGDQFLKQLEKTPGVKTEELDVTGVKQYLLDHPTVTKQELLDYMGESRLKLENKILVKSEDLGSYEDYELRGGDVYHDDDYIGSMADDLHYDMKNDSVIRDQERQALLEADPERYADYDTNPYSQARLEEDIDGVLYEQAKTIAKEQYYESPIRHYYDDHGYEIYGNDEMGYSFKDPNGRFLDIGGNRGVYDLSDAEANLREHLFDQGVLDMTGDGVKYEDYTLPGNYTNYREMLTTLPSKQVKGSDFESSHFDETNILAHTRLNDRIINGKKTLMVEEIQSDWHQKGRKEGYATPISEERKMEIRLELDKLNDMKSYARSQRDAAQKEGLNTINEDMRLANIERQQIELRSELSPKGVPDAPFKKNWHELMMKQILNEAVKGDYDAVAFTTGKQQAERYSLSKQINELRAEKLLSGTKEGQYVITATNKNGNPSVNKTVTEQELENLLGKDLAKKIVEDSPDNPDGKTYSGLDLDVGGEGMKGFYDKVLPDFINKYGKKYGIGVKKANLPSERMPSQEAVNDYFKSINMSRQDFEKLSLDERGKILGNAAPKGDEVHYFDLSDMAKKEIKSKGQPLFSGIGLAAPGLLMDDEDNY